MKNLRPQIGQLFVLGFSGEQPPAPFLEFLREEQIGGVILFEENCGTHERAAENIRLLNSYLRDNPPLIAIDQEGGPVCRLRGAPVEIKASSDYGAGDDLDRFREDYSRAVVLMKSLGINLNLAPVADVWINPKNDCLRDRCFSDDPEQAARFVAASVGVARNNGMLSCLKHFPGLGAAEIDPHKSVSKAHYDRMLWQQRDRIPFAAGIEAGVDMVMSTHLITGCFDDKIATESEKVIRGLLREELGFEGPVITDDLCMKGAHSLGDAGEAAIRAFMAGHDLLLFCHNFEELVEAFEYFAGAVEAGEIPAERVQNALDRIAGVKLKLSQAVHR